MTCVIGMGTVIIKFVSVIQVIMELTVKTTIVDIWVFVTTMENVLIINVFVIMAGVDWNVKERHAIVIQIVIIKEHVLMEFVHVVMVFQDSIVNGMIVVTIVPVADMVSVIRILKSTIVSVMMLTVDGIVSI